MKTSLAVLVVALAIVGGIFLYPLKPVEVQKDTIVLSTTYRNDEYGFEIKIPDDLEVNIPRDGIVFFYSRIQVQEDEDTERDCLVNLPENWDKSMCARNNEPVPMVFV